MSELQMTLATLKDVAGLLELEHASFKTDLLTATQFRSFIKKNSAEVIVVRYEKKIIGCAIVLFRRNSSLARLYSIAISTAFQGKNIAQNLLASVEETARKHDCAEIRLEVSKDNTRAIRFYEKHHYQVFGEYQNFYEDGKPAFRMNKRL